MRHKALPYLILIGLTSCKDPIFSWLVSLLIPRNEDVRAFLTQCSFISPVAGLYLLVTTSPSTSLQSREHFPQVGEPLACPPIITPSLECPKCPPSAIEEEDLRKLALNERPPPP